MNQTRQAAIGAFVLGGGILAVGAVIFFGKFHFGQSADRAAIVFQDSIKGLAIGAPVEFHGVQVGTVTSIAIQIDPTTQVAYIPVIVTLYAGNVRVTRASPTAPVIQNMIARGMHAQLNMVSFVTGQSEIDLDIDPAAPSVLHPTITDLPEIPTKESTLQKMSQQLSEIPFRELAENGNATLRSLRILSDKLVQDLPPLIASLKSTSDQSGNAVQAATGAIDDLHARLDVTLTSITRLANSGNTQVTARGADLHALLTQSEQTVRQARDLVDNLRTLTGDHAASRVDVESTLRNLASAAAALRGFASDIEHNPQLLLTGRRN